MTVVALDLFAGAGGWSVACQRLNIEEHGVEIMPEARAIRAANEMSTIYGDVWEGLSDDRPLELRHPVTYGDYDLLIASPPCQKFSMAGKGAGRSATADVLRLIDERAYLRPDDMRAFAAEHEDDGIALVLTPLAQIARDAPLYVVLEQVPPVLPIWERYAEEMRKWGYSVWTGNLQAEQYGVPQTRKRAILIARADGREAKAPTPTHSRYYSHDPQRLDPGVKPWVSMAEALGWGMTEHPMITAGNAIGRAEGVGGSGGKAAIEREKERGAWRAMRSNYGTGGDPAGRGERSGDEPAPTMTSKADRNQWTAAAMRGRGQTERYGDRPDRSVSDPALTLRANGGGNATAGFTWKDEEGDRTRVTVAEAAALQSFPRDFVWDVEVEGSRGPRPITKTKQFLTIGNAVPPLLAEAVLREVLS